MGKGLPRQKSEAVRRCLLEIYVFCRFVFKNGDLYVFKLAVAVYDEVKLISRFAASDDGYNVIARCDLGVVYGDDSVSCLKHTVVEALFYLVDVHAVCVYLILLSISRCEDVDGGDTDLYGCGICNVSACLDYLGGNGAIIYF